jgi:hypothetical protein
VSKLEGALCVWLRASLGLNAEQVATAIGWSVSGGRHVQALYLKEGDAVFRRPGRGGARRHLLTTAEQGSLLRRVGDESRPFGVVDFRTIHAQVEKAVGRPVPPSTVHRMLDRNGWGRQTLVLHEPPAQGDEEEKVGRVAAGIDGFGSRSFDSNSR